MSFFEELKRRNVFRVGIAYGVAGWVLLQIADLVLDNVTAPEWVMHVLMLLVALGFIAALVVAWAYEVTPEGIRRESDVDRSQSVTQHTAKKLDMITLAAIGVLVLFMLIDRFVLEEEEIGSDPFSRTTEQETSLSGEKRDLTPAVPNPDTPPVNNRSIAVLPLANRSVNPEDAFLAEGMHDEILTRLSRIGALKVISRTSVMGYAGTTKKMAEIGQELAVSNILEGGVQRAGNRVRINVQLIEAATDRHLWAEIYDREMTTDNLFDIQSEITRSISDALEAVLTGAEQQALAEKPTDNIEAYAHYLRGKASSNSYGRSTAERKEAIDAYQSAIDLDPRFAQAYAAMSTDWMETYWQSSKLGDERDRALVALNKAQQLAPDSAETLIAEGYYHYWGFLDYAEAIAAFDKALAKQPGSQLALRGKAYVLRRLGQLDESIATMNRAIELDPMDFSMPADLGYTLSQVGRVKEADQMYRRALAQNPKNPWNRSSYATFLIMMNDLEGARNQIGPVTADLQGYELAQHFYLAWLARDQQTMDAIIKPWKQDEFGPEEALIAQAQVLLAKGDMSVMKPELESARERLLSADRKTPDEESTLSSLAQVYGLLGDTEALHSTMDRMDRVLKPDAMRIVEDDSIPNACASAGDAAGFLEYFERVNEQFGPWQLFPLAQNPLYQRFAGEPRFKLMALEYDRWLEKAMLELGH